jgi:hypothetical protein
MKIGENTPYKEGQDMNTDYDDMLWIDDERDLSVEVRPVMCHGTYHVHIQVFKCVDGSLDNVVQGFLLPYERILDLILELDRAEKSITNWLEVLDKACSDDSEKSQGFLSPTEDSDESV